MYLTLEQILIDRLIFPISWRSDELVVPTSHQIWTVSTMLDMIRLDINIINMRFEYSDTDTVSDVKYSDSNTNRFKTLLTDSLSNTVGTYPYHFHPL
jgi:hypothetical protein